jgi:hypothetical protein
MLKDLKDEEEVVHICEPEAGKSLSDDEEERSSRDLRNCQGGQRKKVQVSRWAMKEVIGVIS